MLTSILLLLMLAVYAFKTKKILVPGLVFGAAKAIAAYFLFLAETDFQYTTAILLVGAQFTFNGLLGVGIARMVVRHSQDWKYVFPTTVMAVLTLLSTMIEQNIV